MNSKSPPHCCAHAWDSSQRSALALLHAWKTTSSYWYAYHSNNNHNNNNTKTNIKTNSASNGPRNRTPLRTAELLVEKSAGNTLRTATDTSCSLVGTSTSSKLHSRISAHYTYQLLSDVRVEGEVQDETQHGLQEHLVLARDEAA